MYERNLKKKKRSKFDFDFKSRAENGENLFSFLYKYI